MFTWVDNVWGIALQEAVSSRLALPGTLLHPGSILLLRNTLTLPGPKAHLAFRPWLQQQSWSSAPAKPVLLAHLSCLPQSSPGTLPASLL